MNVLPILISQLLPFSNCILGPSLCNFQILSEVSDKLVSLNELHFLLLKQILQSFDLILLLLDELQVDSDISVLSLISRYDGRVVMKIS